MKLASDHYNMLVFASSSLRSSRLRRCASESFISSVASASFTSVAGFTMSISIVLTCFASMLNTGRAARRNFCGHAKS